ncbi:hypothetical protein GCM10010353_67010 [Streptomyces chryseus]|nr:hypothetical protein GCM10010353_67010 [Streptomyces chryseus]
MQQGGEDGVDGAAGAGEEAKEIDGDSEAVVLPYDAQGVDDPRFLY